MSTSRQIASLVTAAALIVAACGGPPEDDLSTTAGPPSADTVVVSHEQAISAAQRMDERLPYGAGRNVSVTLEDGTQQQLRHWTEDGRTVLVMATGTDRSPRGVEHTSYYFDEDGLFFVRDSEGRYVFRSGELEVWLDDRLSPIDVDGDRRAAKQEEIQLALHAYLGQLWSGE